MLTSVVTSFELLADRLAETLRCGRWAVPLAAVLLFAIFRGNLEVDPDLFARVAVGRLVATTGVAALDPFAFTQTKSAWIDHEWLSGWIFYEISVQAGDFGLFTFKVLCAALSLAILFCAARARQKSLQLAVWLIVVAWACSYVWVSTVRSQVFTYLALPIFLWTFVNFENSRKISYLFCLPLVTLFWANAHGGFVVGLGLLLLFGIGLWPSDRAASLKVLVVLAVCVVATIFNPYGFGPYWRYIIDALGMQRSTISEWAPIDVLSMQGVFPIGLGLLVLWGVWLRRSELDFVAILLIGASWFFGFRHNRLIAIFYMVTFVYGSKFIFAAFERGVPESLALKLQRVTVFLATLAGFAAIVSLVRFVVLWSDFSLDRSSYPERAVSWLKENRSGGKLLVDFSNGSFALFRLYPRFQISVDGRYEEVYPEATVKLVSDALEPSSPTQLDSLARVAPDYALIAANNSAKFKENTDPNWREIYCDLKFCVFEDIRTQPLGETKKAADLQIDSWATDF